MAHTLINTHIILIYDRHTCMFYIFIHHMPAVLNVQTLHNVLQYFFIHPALLFNEQTQFICKYSMQCCKTSSVHGVQSNITMRTRPIIVKYSCDFCESPPRSLKANEWRSADMHMDNLFPSRRTWINDDAVEQIRYLFWVQWIIIAGRIWIMTEGLQVFT